MQICRPCWRRARYNPVADVRKPLNVRTPPNSSMRFARAPGPHTADRGFFDRARPSMSPPDAAGGAGFADEQGPQAVAQAGSGRPASRSRYGKVHAVPVRDVVGSSGRLAEALYRGFEVLVALLGLTLGLPLMLVEAIVVRWDSPGPALFFHHRPGRSIMMRGRDLEGRADLIPPPGGYQPHKLYYVPSYFR